MRMVLARLENGQRHLAGRRVLLVIVVARDELASVFIFNNLEKSVRATGEVDTNPPRYSEWRRERDLTVGVAAATCLRFRSDTVARACIAFTDCL